MSDTLREALEQNLGAGFRIEREIPSGQASRVFLAEDLALNRRVVVKAVASEAAVELSVERFRREMQVTARLQHPHIVPVLQAGFAAGVPYYVMPFVEGRSLRERMDTPPELTTAETVEILRDVLSALAYAHDNGIVHRDIKPQNILFSPGGGAVVTDFGIAKAINTAAVTSTGGTTEVGIALGTPAYMSPEQVVADPNVDHRSDLYAVGALAYEMLSGKQLFGGRSTADVFRAHVLETPPPLDRPGIPPELAALVMKALSKGQAERPQSAAEMLRALGDSVSTGASAGLVSVRSRRRWVKRLSMAGGIALAASLIAWVAAPKSMLATLRTVVTREAATLHPERVVVMPFENETGDSTLAPLGQMASDWITQGLARTGVVQVVDARTATLDAQIVKEMPWVLRGDRVRAVARETGAGTVVAGSYYRDGDQLRFQAQVVDARDGRLVRAVDPVSGPASQPTQLIERLRERTMGALASVIDTGATWSVGMAAPPSYDAYVEAVQGLKSFVREDTSDAFARLDRAASLDSTYLLPLLVAAYAHASIGLDVPDASNVIAASALLVRAERHLAQAIPSDRLMTDFLQRWSRGDIEAAVRTGEDAIRLMPSSDNAVIVAAIASAVGRPRAALRAMKGIDLDRGTRLVAPAAWRWRIVALHLAADSAEETATAARARRRFPQDAEILGLEAIALATRGDVKGARRALASVASAPNGTPAILTNVTWRAALELRNGGHPAEARAMLESALKTAPTDSTFASLVSRGTVLYELDKFDEAQAAFALCATMDASTAECRGYLGLIAARRNDKVEAARRDREIATLDLPVPLKARAAVFRARMAALSGDRGTAVSLLRDAIDHGAGLGNPIHHGFATIMLLREFSALRGFPPFDALRRPRD